MATVSRLVLNHPPLGTIGGSSLHTQIEALYTKIGDAINSRWFQVEGFDTGESFTLEHNFDTDIDNIRYKIYVYAGDKWVLTTDESTPLRSAFQVAEATGLEDTHVTVTNVSAGNDLLCAVVLINDPLSLEDGDLKDVDVSGATEGMALVYDEASDIFVANNVQGVNVVANFGDQDISGSSVTTPLINATGVIDFVGLEESPVPPDAGDIRVYAKDDNKLYVQTDNGIEQAVGSGGSIVLINKVAHGFTDTDIGCPLYIDASGDYQKAKADVSNTAEVAGLFNKKIDDDNFEVCLGGEVSSVGTAAAPSGLVVGEVYFLSADTAGLLVTSEPSVLGQVSKPVGIARTTTAIEFFNMRGITVGGVNARTVLSLANNASSNVQSFASYDAAELTGWVYINGTSDYRFYLSAQVSKKGDGLITSFLPNEW